LLGRDVGLELAQVVDRTLAVGRGDYMLGVLPDFLGDLAPGLLNGSNAVDECAVLMRKC
jgi:hypothetical protein